MGDLLLKDIPVELEARIKKNAYKRLISPEELAVSILDENVPTISNHGKPIDKAKEILRTTKNQSHTCGIQLKSEIYNEE